MALSDDLKDKVKAIFKDAWTTRDGQVVPSDTSVTMGNDGVKIDGTVLYADLTASTKLVNSKSSEFAAEIYKSYLHCAAKIIRSEGGEITAYDGDRIMAVYLGSSKNTSAVRSALKINYAVRNIINPALKNQYSSSDYEVSQVVGIDTSSLLVAKTGIRGSNDLVWVGRAANYAAKLCSLKIMPTYITEAIYSNIAAEAKMSNGVDMWEKRVWTEMDGINVYRSNYWWAF